MSILFMLALFLSYYATIKIMRAIKVSKQLIEHSEWLKMLGPSQSKAATSTLRVKTLLYLIYLQAISLAVHLRRGHLGGHYRAQHLIQFA